MFEKMIGDNSIRILGLNSDKDVQEMARTTQDHKHLYIMNDKTALVLVKAIKEASNENSLIVIVPGNTAADTVYRQENGLTLADFEKLDPDFKDSDIN